MHSSVHVTYLLAGADIPKIIYEIQESLNEEQRIERNVGWNVIFSPTPSIRRMLIVGVGAAICQQVCGIDAINYYLCDILEDSGVEDEYEQAGWLIMFGLLKVIFIVLAMKLMDQIGRRPLMLSSCAGMFVMASFMFS